jgi:ABC-type uncharacterized transport system ATPase subunit
MSVPLAIADAARAAAHQARAVSEGAAVTAGVEVALAADRRWWARLLLGRLDSLPITASSQRELLTALAEEFSAAADEIHHGTGKKLSV